MEFLRRLFGQKVGIQSITGSNGGADIESSYEMRKVFSSPSLLSSWSLQNVVKSFSVEEDFESAPEEETRKDLNITFGQVERLAREQGLLRAVGVAFLVKQYYDDAFYLKFFSKLYKPVADHMYGKPTSEQVDETRYALETYVNALDDEGDEDMKAFQRIYLQRIYDDNDSYYKLLLGGIGVLALRTSYDVYEIIRNEYFKAHHGMSYEGYRLITESLDRVEKDSDA